MINTTDFTGKWAIAQNSFSRLQDYIDRYENKYLVDLMGKELADDFITDPSDVKWDELKVIGFGLTSLLVGFVYFEYVRDLPFRVTNGNVMYTQEENGRTVLTAIVLRQRYNECVRDYKEMQKYLKDNFDEFKGVRKKYIND